MKRAGNLWPELTSFGNLLAAAEAASAGKRRRPDVAVVGLAGTLQRALRAHKRVLSHTRERGV